MQEVWFKASGRDKGGGMEGVGDLVQIVQHL